MHGNAELQWLDTNGTSSTCIIWDWAIFIQNIIVNLVLQFIKYEIDFNLGVICVSVNGKRLLTSVYERL